MPTLSNVPPRRDLTVRGAEPVPLAGAWCQWSDGSLARRNITAHALHLVHPGCMAGSSSVPDYTIIAAQGLLQLALPCAAGSKASRQVVSGDMGAAE
jgi:hypothetical protein